MPQEGQGCRLAITLQGLAEPIELSPNGQENAFALRIGEHDSVYTLESFELTGEISARRDGNALILTIKNAQGGVSVLDKANPQRKVRFVSMEL
ncbi:MAG: hypothetical protein ACYC1C_18290 [Chloroflexota bacterium]